MLREVKEIEMRILKLNKAYRIGKPEVSDQEYDRLVDQLKEIYPESELFKGRIMDIVREGKELLPFRMASLDKVKSTEELKKWLLSNDIKEDEVLVITPKLDGISLLTDERSFSCWTRGDGIEGMRVDTHYSLIDTKAEFRNHITFGEAIMKRSVFRDKYSKEYKSARNMVAGLMNRIEATEPLIDVDYIRYGMDVRNMNKVSQLDILNTFNSVKIPYEVCRVKYIDDLNFSVLYNKWSQDYEIDGLVIDINNHILRDALDREKNGNPAYARALKLPQWNSVFETTVKDIKWGVSKQGKLKPVIQVEPIKISGVTISNVTGFNARFIQQYQIKIGSRVVVSRKGDVIPGIIKVEDIWVK